MKGGQNGSGENRRLSENTAQRKGLTQEQLAEKFNVAGRTISRWETGSNMPDLSILVELADFYDVDIREIIDGERKSEKMDSEVKDTLVKVAEYGDVGKKNEKRKFHQIIGGILAVFGLFIIISALAIFPTDSSWGSIYSLIGCVMISSGIFKLCTALKITKIIPRLVCSIACFIIIFLCLCGLDYLGVKNFNQPPRFCYENPMVVTASNTRLFSIRLQDIMSIQRMNIMCLIE